MTRAQQTISIGLLITSLYLALYLQLIPLPSLISNEIIPVLKGGSWATYVYAASEELPLPFWALVSFGACLLFKLGFGVLTFNDVPEAHAELMKEIELARADLRTKGVDVD
ncbi:Dolichyl-phosphate mannosyltransferase polypeptide 3 [Venustampulla echinocandica]|uniref:Dolichol-phosphate mannosyltransferase subunit 3 n=1 Tax=Venustampulla echinocandica TaxID=2656787 RepID=A0A370U252_9HELO|nr:Dolichyl-phosphate mannosyltransferase polypeptide 3 [Venustampulla echinocandica]RDL41862.1 Dolichyl-phosphate mannosyltransferase polypeptide 3 [Venustampulla echinocandica]